MVQILRINKPKPVQMPGLGAPVSTIGPRYGVLSIPQKQTVAKKAAGAGAGTTTPAIPVNQYAGVVKAIGKILTPAQQLAQARALVSPSITQELAAYNKSAGLESSQVSAQALRAQEYAKALGQLTAPSADAIKNQYMSAAAFEGGLGQGLTGDVAQGWQDATDRANAQAQQMTGGIGGSVGQYDPAAARSVAVLTGAAMPASTLAEQGSNAYAMAQFARQANVAQVGDIAQQYLQKLTDLKTTQDAERAKILAQRPDLVMKELGNLQTQHQNQITSLYNLANAQQKAKTDAATLAINWAAQQTKQQSADAYNSYLLGKTNLSAQELAWKKKYDQALIKDKQVKNVLAAAGVQIKKGQLVVAQTQAATAQERADTAKTEAAAKTFLNPYTGKVESKPSGTIIGKNGLPIDPTPSGTAAKAKAPSL